MKKILYFVPTFPVISETFIEREISTLINFNNLDITVLALAKGRGSVSENLNGHVVYRRLDIITCIKAIKFFITKPKKLLILFSQLQGFKPSNFYLLLKAIGYTCLIEEYKPEHIHVHFLSDPSTIAMVSSYLLNIPFSISGHAKDVFLTGTFIPQKVATAKFVSICNDYAYKKCLQLAGTSDTAKVVKIYHGVNASYFEGKSSLPKPDVPVIFMGGTRLVEKKGLTYVIEASKILKDKGLRHRVDIVGTGPSYNELVSKIKQLGLEDTVIIYNEGKGLPFAEVAEYYKIATIFVYPAIETADGDVDGVPTVVIEAALAKLPIIATSAGSISDLVTEQTGIIVPQKDPEAIADSILKLLNNSTLSERLVSAAYAKASEMFNLERNIKVLENKLLL